MMDYNAYSAKQCFEKLDRFPKRILIIGAGSEARDVEIFNLLTNGQSEIHGVDIVENVGSRYKSDNVVYLNCSVYDLPYRSEYFDLAYSFATFEHIKNLKLGWQNMLDSLRKGGLLFCVSSPLWHSPFGHHKSNIFKNHPWIHLLYDDPDKLIKYCIDNNISSPDSTELIHHIKYMLNDEYFNKLKPSAYINAAENLTSCNVTNSSFSNIEPQNPESYKNVIDSGFKVEEIMPITHYLECIKT